MFAIPPPSPPVWIEPVKGVRLQLRAVTSTGRAVALAASTRAFAAGAAPDEAAAAFTLALIGWGLVDWEGVGDEAGVALPPTAENAARLLECSWEIYDAVDQGYVLPALALEAEKNGSSPAPDGGSAGATDTAPPAPPPARDAPTP